MTTVPRPPNQRNFVCDTSFFGASRAELVRRRESIASLRAQAASDGERQSWDHADRQIARDLRRYEPCRLAVQTPRRSTSCWRITRTTRSARAPRRVGQAQPPPGGGDDDPDPDGDPPANPDADAIAALGRILGLLLPGDYAVAELIVSRIRSAGPNRETGIMQVALAVWAAGLDGIVVDCRDVCAVLGVDNISASTFPMVAVALGVEFVVSGPAIASLHHTDRCLSATAVLS